MRATRRTDTRPEVRLRSTLHRMGYRFRKDFPVETGSRLVRVDIVFPRQRLAVFVDGCFWHGCPDHCRLPHENADYRTPKIQGNRARDETTDRLLSSLGWRVFGYGSTSRLKKRRP
jgi:DNA mismatch endonuclease (patch repair protein)